jgi:transposase
MLWDKQLPEEAAMDREARREAYAQLIAQMQAGQSWHEAAKSAGIQISRASAYRLLRRVRTEGVVALEDQRHGHPTKVRQPVRDWLAEFCRAAPASTGRIVQAAMCERFGLQISVSQINRLRAALGVSRPEPGAGEKSVGRTLP